LALALVYSCNRDELSFESASQKLRFSKDTVLLDTVFSSVRSETYALKVYNQEDKDVSIPRIYLENGGNSWFKINVDGTAGVDFHDIPIRAHDSLYIFVEIAPKAVNSSDMLADENLIFNTLNNTQSVKLLALVEDADFYYSPDGKTEISSDLTWNNAKSKVIYGNLKVTKGAKLTIDEGTRVYFHKGASLTIDENSELNINGTLGKEVILRGDRNDPKYDSLPKNWENIYLSSLAIAKVNYAIVKGGTDAFVLEPASQLEISNTQIYNFSNTGIYAIGAEVTGKNLVANNCGNADLMLQFGGNYDFTHCTFANFYNLTPASGYAAYLSNSYDNQYNALNAVFKNCIFWTGKSSNNSLYFNKSEQEAFHYVFDTNLIKNSSNGIKIEGDPNFINIILNENPSFTNTQFSKNLLNLKPDSPAFGKGNVTYANAVPYDIKGVLRTSSPTLGAYQQ
jgi:hypothetical protein